MSSRHFKLYLLQSRVVSAPVAILAISLFISSTAGQVKRQDYLNAKPLAQADVQQLTATPPQTYTSPNVMMVQPTSEDPLSYYVRTQDGEWSIPNQVNSEDPWVRLLVLGPQKPSLIDVAVEINGEPFRAAREKWITRLIEEAKTAFLVRTAAAAADSAEISATKQNSTPTDSTEATESGVETEEKVSAEGTSQEDASSEDTEAQTNDEEPEIQLVTAQRRKTRTLFQRLINYLAAGQSTVDREEVRWLLAEWTGGPAQLTLSPAFAWRRADQAPLWHALDRDRNDQLDAEEIQQAANMFASADINQDDLVDLTELKRAAKGSATSHRTKGYPLIVVIDSETEWQALLNHLRKAYPLREQQSDEASLLDRLGQGDRSVQVTDLHNLLSVPADFTYRVAFAEEEPNIALLATGVTESSNQPAKGWELHSSTPQVITVARPGAYVELAAGQGSVDPENESGDMQQTQIAVGAIVDGYPLFRLLDQDNNKQLSRREEKRLPEVFQSIDQNQDQQIDHHELPVAIRLMVTLGPQAHEHLAEPVAAPRAGGGSEPVQVPDWFTDMDQNHDGDLSKREFLGSPAQFAKFDRDQDGLISQLEVQEPKNSGKTAQ